MKHIFPPYWQAEQAHNIIYKPYASTNFTLNQYNEFERGSIVFCSNSICICALYRIKKKKFKSQLSNALGFLNTGLSDLFLVCFRACYLFETFLKNIY